MPSDSKSPKPKWSVSELIDLEYLLRRDEETGDASNDGFFADEIEPWIDPGKIDRPDARTLQKALWRWLQTRKSGLETSKLPGAAISGAFWTVGTAIVLFMAFLGAGTVLGTLGYEDSRTYNVLLLFGLTVGIQWLFLTLGLLGLLAWLIWRNHAFVSFAHRGFQSIVNHTAERTMSKEAAVWWRENAKTRRLFTMPTMLLTQAAGIAFNVGAIAALVGSVLFVSVRFGWETTAENTMNPALSRATEVLGVPWSWFKPEWVPDQEEIAQSRIRWQGSPLDPIESAILTAEESARAWFPFLVCSIAFWGLLPRLLLYTGFDLRRRSELRGLAFSERIHREWWRNLTDIPIEVTTKGPADNAVALLWGGVKPAEPELRVAALQQLRVNVIDTFPAGGAEVDEDTKAIAALEKLLRKSDLRIVLVVEAWSLAPRDLGDFLDQLRGTIGASAPVDCYLIGLPQNGKTLTAPKDSEIKVWETFAAERSDPALFIKPFRSQ